MAVTPRLIVCLVVATLLAGCSGPRPIEIPTQARDRIISIEPIRSIGRFEGWWLANSAELAPIVGPHKIDCYRVVYETQIKHESRTVSGLLALPRG